MAGGAPEASPHQTYEETAGGRAEPSANRDFFTTNQAHWRGDAAVR